ncbi:MAG: uroporphyrinogen decarboxylase family protein [Bacteroidota bacterium]
MCKVNMTGRERMNMAMNKEHPDRVPVMAQFSIGFMIQQLKEHPSITPMELWNDADKFAEALIWLRERFEFDGILCGIHGQDPNWRDKVTVEMVDGIEVATFHDRKEIYVDDDLPVGKFFKETLVDIDTFDPTTIPDELDFISASKDCYVNIFPDDKYRVFDILEEKLKGEFSIHGEVSSPLDYLLDLLGYENALMAMMTHPDKCKDILQRYTVGVINMAEGICDQNSVDAIKISSPFAGSDFISPESYREFELPYVTQLATAVKNKGKFVYIHTCGHINDRLEMMAESGVSGLECLDPEPIGNVALDDAFNRIGDDMFIKGNVDSVHTLLNGSDEKVLKDVSDRVKIGMKNKGYILSTACSIAPKVSEKNVAILAKIAKEIGNYKEEE